MTVNERGMETVNKRMLHYQVAIKEDILVHKEFIMSLWLTDGKAPDVQEESDESEDEQPREKEPREKEPSPAPPQPSPQPTSRIALPGLTLDAASLKVRTAGEDSSVIRCTLYYGGSNLRKWLNKCYIPQARV